jgi:SAM-dependent methyltransferase
MRMLRGRVSGLDAHAGAIAFARSQGLDARQATLPPIPFPDAEFDAVVTFETIEHIEDDAVYVAEIWRVLKPGGVLLLSTPNKDTSSPEGPPSNPWHRREYRLDDLRRLLATFANVEVYGQGFIPTPRVARQATRLTSRFPVLCPYLWRVAGLGNVVRWDGQFTPSIWALHATKPL